MPTHCVGRRQCRSTPVPKYSSATVSRPCPDHACIHTQAEGSRRGDGQKCTHREGRAIAGQPAGQMALPASGLRPIRVRSASVFFGIYRSAHVRTRVVLREHAKSGARQGGSDPVDQWVTDLGVLRHCECQRDGCGDPRGRTPTAACSACTRCSIPIRDCVQGSHPTAGAAG
eukprot:gene9211-biopygen18191